MTKRFANIWSTKRKETQFTQEGRDRDYISAVCPFKQNHTTSPVTSSKMVTSFVKFNGRYDVDCYGSIKSTQSIKKTNVDADSGAWNSVF